MSGIAAGGTSLDDCHKCPAGKWSDLNGANALNPEKHLRVVTVILGARTLLGAPGIAIRSKDAARGSWPYC